MNENLCAVIAAWLNDSQTSQDGVCMAEDLVIYEMLRMKFSFIR